MSIQTGDGVQTHLCTLNAWRQITEPVRADHVERINNRTQNKTKTLIDELNWAAFWCGSVLGVFLVWMCIVCILVWLCIGGGCIFGEKLGEVVW